MIERKANFKNTNQAEKYIKPAGHRFLVLPGRGRDVYLPLSRKQAVKLLLEAELDHEFTIDAAGNVGDLLFFRRPEKIYGGAA